MGEDSVKPFLEYPGKWVILLGLTSNKGSTDFQFLETSDGKLFETVIRKAKQWASPDNLMFVVGATHPEEFKAIRALAPEHFYLVPGIGAQGGELDQVCLFGLNDHCGLLINSSRQIIYASSGDDFAIAARQIALQSKAAMQKLVKTFGKE